ncbi:hypothetical protein B0H16DRAFT_1709947 [Mycena metata]|uniref:Uncharacterized protein n=1 Tax=Mycena metata TaxID=1033252 RepID=A0AAD7KEN7_9AGAR|nr:hypothetical protein B0H16DRAFT_1709947 [Mycena metata]
MASLANKDNATSLFTTPTLTASSTALHHLPHALRSACRTTRERNRLWWLIRLSGVWITPTAGVPGTPTPESHRAPPLTTRFWASRKGRGRRGFRRSCNVGSQSSSCLVLDDPLDVVFRVPASQSSQQLYRRFSNSLSFDCAQFAPSFSSITGSNVRLVRLTRCCFFVRAVFVVFFFIASMIAMTSTDSLSPTVLKQVVFLSYTSLGLEIPDLMNADFCRPATHSVLDQLDPADVHGMRHVVFITLLKLTASADFVDVPGSAIYADLTRTLGVVSRSRSIPGHDVVGCCPLGYRLTFVRISHPVNWIIKLPSILGTDRALNIGKAHMLGLSGVVP